MKKPITKTNYVLVDYESLPLKSMTPLLDPNFYLLVFLGKNNANVPREVATLVKNKGDRADFVELSESGKNALDFLIIFTLGQLVLKDPNGFFHILSKDTGFDALIRHLKTKQVFSARSESIESMPCFALPAAVAAKPEKVAPPPTAARLKTPVAKAKPPAAQAAKSVVATLLERAISDLKARNSNNKAPKTSKGLLNTIHSKIGHDRPVAEAQSVFDQLVSRKYVVVAGLKVSYKLPK